MFVLTVMAVVVSVVAIDARAQEATEPSDASVVSTKSGDDLAQYEQLITKIRTDVAETQEASLQFFVNGLDESHDWKKSWVAGKEKIGHSLADFRATACRIYGSDLPQPESLDAIIGPITQDMYSSNQLQDLDIAFEKMLKANPDDVELQKKIVMLYLKTNRFKESFDLINSLDPKKAGEFEKSDRKLLVFLPSLVKSYEKELEIREQEKQADDLPRVEIVTTRGTMVVELFENEAPETVANFIALVEAGHYDDTIFHRVISDFMAQGGGISASQQDLRLNYTINDEFKNPNFRRHFSGSLSMANTGRPKSGAGGFFINLVPTPFLDGKHTVFGRVIAGTAVYQRITLTYQFDEKGVEKPFDSAVPDKIISAKVIRKRDHAYQPVKAIH